ncbi:hypothetical protein [Nonomuraea endophytica]|uniref:ABC-type phosphate transport system auxiliary subunit n=1 Tax=Nonomuraea endophytica TaxID=714136 RepID=A0A7W8AB71_9ACTN|nr:hypothetical protein [Nonomuraea endophytica]MBB5082994.1 ABC-type phosphate transport system auxiliary subunit [Nonomuraea endophytica]
MTVSIPLVALLGVALVIALRFLGLRLWQAIVCTLFGFLLAATALAPDIRHVLTGLMDLITGR